VDGDLDFWLGEWDVRWDGGSGTNTVARDLDGAAIVERFESPELRGLSVSVFERDVWRQTWVDSNRSYLDFEGGRTGDEFQLLNLREDAQFRMRFTEIASDSLVWLWERRTDDGWELKWRIDYSRRLDLHWSTRR
jgi:hypothetical protein